jgi:beta-lactamase class A
MTFLRMSSRAFALALLASLCATTPRGVEAATHPTVETRPSTGLQAQLEDLARRARPGTFGITVLDLHSGQAWRVNAVRAFPMMSVFKAPVAAAVLDRIERGRLAMDHEVVIRRDALESGTIRDHFHGERMRFTVGQLLTAAVSRSDNTAVDALLPLAGGPGAVTAFLRAHGIEGMRVDTGERGFRPLFEDLKPGRQPPADETDAQQLARLRRGYRAYLADPRNRSTPDAAADFLRKLWDGQLLAPAPTRRLLDLMYAQTTPSRLRQGLPPGVRLADKCGTSYTLEKTTAAYNDIGILSWPDGRAVAVAAFLTASTASRGERDALFADLARAVAAALHPAAGNATAPSAPARRSPGASAAPAGSGR